MRALRVCVLLLLALWLPALLEPEVRALLVSCCCCFAAVADAACARGACAARVHAALACALVPGVARARVSCTARLRAAAACAVVSGAARIRGACAARVVVLLLVLQLPALLEPEVHALLVYVLLLPVLWFPA